MTIRPEAEPPEIVAPKKAAPSVIPPRPEHGQPREPKEQGPCRRNPQAASGTALRASLRAMIHIGGLHAIALSGILSVSSIKETEREA